MTRHAFRDAAPYPTLDAEQIARMTAHGETRDVGEGEILFDVGQAAYPLILVLQGRVSVVDPERPDRPWVRARAGQFLGELGLLTGQTTFARALADEPSRVLLLSPDAVRRVVSLEPELSDLIVGAFAARRDLLAETDTPIARLVADADDADAMTLEEFLDRNRQPYRRLTPDEARDEGLADLCGPDGPHVLVRDRVLTRPRPTEVARALGLDRTWTGAREAVDLAVIGAGPAGLGAAVYAASEGLDTAVIDAVAIGGQAGWSSRIENYFGFPTGISGSELAFRAEVQAVKFGARVAVPRRAVRLEPRDGAYAIQFDEGEPLTARAVVLALGARYRRLGLNEDAKFDGRGVYYAATEIEARRCVGRDVLVIGGGNSAGQAAMYLSRHARRVSILCRSESLAESMSAYLIDRLESCANVRIRLKSRVASLHGDGGLEAATVETEGREPAREEVCAVFVMIGAAPRTEWLQGTVELDRAGFVVTGGEGRSPFETSLPGVFAVGDVRAGSVKRVASAVGEGGMVVSAVHARLAATA